MTEFLLNEFTRLLTMKHHRHTTYRACSHAFRHADESRTTEFLESRERLDTTESVINPLVATDKAPVCVAQRLGEEMSCHRLDVAASAVFSRPRKKNASEKGDDRNFGLPGEMSPI